MVDRTCRVNVIASIHFLGIGQEQTEKTAKGTYSKTAKGKEKTGDYQRKGIGWPGAVALGYLQRRGERRD
jgi:hypothetical protein